MSGARSVKALREWVLLALLFVLVARLEALERAVEPAAIAPQPSIDALLVMAAVQAARGDVGQVQSA